MRLDSAESSLGTTVKHLPGRNECHAFSLGEHRGGGGAGLSCWLLPAIPAGGYMYGRVRGGRRQGGLAFHNFLIWMGDVGISLPKDQH